MERSSSPAPIAVVTGASSGIGAELARGLARRGYATWLVARRENRLIALADELRPHAQSTVVPLDLADADAVQAKFETLLAEAEAAPQLLINNAGFGVYRRFLDHGSDDDARLMQVNYHTPALLTRLLLPGMLKAGRGQVINIASIASVMGPWGHGSYAASKAALVALTQSLAADYADAPVHFSYVNPGLVATPFFAAPNYRRMLDRNRRQAIEPRAAAARILSLIDRPQLALTIPRHFQVMSLIAAISPRLAHRIVMRQSRPAPPPRAADALPPSADPARQQA